MAGKIQVHSFALNMHLLTNEICSTVTWRNADQLQLAIQENYRDNPFHNFRHCFCVSQMMYGMIHLCNLQVWTSLWPIIIQFFLWCLSRRCIPFIIYSCHCCSQEKLTMTDMCILMTAAVCHDLDHPGYNNTYISNCHAHEHSIISTTSKQHRNHSRDPFVQ